MLGRVENLDILPFKFSFNLIDVEAMHLTIMLQPNSHRSLLVMKVEILGSRQKWVTNTITSTNVLLVGGKHG